MNTGSCLCGKIKYRVRGALGDVRYCYCEACRKVTGSAFTANAKIPFEKFEFIEGKNFISVYESSPNKFRYFCSQCASPIYASVGEEPAFVRVRLGGLNFNPETQITAHMWVSEKPEWFVIADDLPQYPTIYDGSKN
ncbi:MAG: GFA family protein [Pseudomonadales bacterium]|nr:GFA family protein [Pseudomonadales bacterium]